MPGTNLLAFVLTSEVKELWKAALESPDFGFNDSLLGNPEVRRQVDLLCGMGTVRKVNLESGEVRYRVMDPHFLMFLEYQDLRKREMGSLLDIRELQREVLLGVTSK